MQALHVSKKEGTLVMIKRMINDKHLFSLFLKIEQWIMGIEGVEISKSEVI
jgi:hypothetical protein